jgi:hypothetical protein
MTISLRGLDPHIRDAAQWSLDVAAYYKVPVTVTSANRPWAQQEQLRHRYEGCLARGERVYPENPDEGCRFPANEPGDSAHNYGLAWDSWVPEEFRPWWQAVREYAGFRVPSNDWVHAEYPDWRTWKPALKRV